MTDEKELNSLDTEFEDPLSDFEPRVYPNVLAEALAEETVAAIPSHPYACICPTTPVYRALQALAGLKVSSVLVADDDGLQGIFTERDVLERVAEQFEKVKELPVKELMTTRPIVVYAHEPIGKALSAIAASGYRHVPVLDVHDKIVGVVSPRRLFAFLQQRFDIGI